MKYNGKALRLNKDYTVSYADPSKDGKTPGTYTVNLEAKPDSQNFTGSTTIRMILADKDKQILMTKVSIGKIAAQNYQKDEDTERGKIQTPDITVKEETERNMSVRTTRLRQKFRTRKAAR